MKITTHYVISLAKRDKQNNNFILGEKSFFESDHVLCETLESEPENRNGWQTCLEIPHVFLSGQAKPVLCKTMRFGHLCKTGPRI